MKNLADSVLDYFWFLNFCEEEECDPDYTLKLMESLVHEIENTYSDEERQSLSEAASRRLESWLCEPDEHGYTPRLLLTPEQKRFLEDIASGRFNGLEGEE